MKAKIKMKIKWAKDMIEIHRIEFEMDSKEKHLKRIDELKGMIECLEELI